MCVKEAFRETAVLAVFSWLVMGCLVAGLRGPYNQFTSLSLSLGFVSIGHDIEYTLRVIAPVKRLGTDSGQLVFALDPCPPSRILKSTLLSVNLPL